MEKFTAFAHAATGVNPFLPKGRAPALWKIVIMTPLIGLRLAVIGVLVALLYVVDWIPVLRTFLVPLVCHLLLTTAGFFSPQEIANDSRKTGVTSSTSAAGSAEFVVAQYQSPLDVLIACFALSVFPEAFVFPAEDGRLLAVRSVVAALGVALSEEQPAVGNCDQVPNRAVVFACGARTNGAGLLRWPATVTQEKKRLVSLLAVQYDGSVPHTTRSGMRYVAELVSSVGHLVRYTAVDGVASETARVAMCRLSSALRYEPVVETDLTAEKAREFRKFFGAAESAKQKTQ
jgi:hypothetical protein